MKMFRPIALLLSLCLCAGCFDVTEEYWFNKDRSGRYEMTIDLASMGSLMSMMQSFAPKNDSLGARPDMPRDTVISLASLPDSIKKRLPFPALADQSSVAMKLESGFKMTFVFNFQEVGQIAQFWQNFSAMDTVSKSNDLGAFAGFRAFLGNVQTNLQWEGKTLQLKASPATASTDPRTNPMANQDMNNPMVKMMFGSNHYRQKFHFASKVRSVHGDSMQHDGKEAWSSYSMADVMADPTVLSCSIKIKR